MTERNEYLKLLTKKKFKRKRYLKSRIKPRFPSRIEEEYARFLRQYMKHISGIIKSHIPEIKSILNDRREINLDETDKQKKGFVKAVSFFNLSANELNELIQRIEKEIVNSSGIFDVYKKLTSIADRTRKYNINEFSNMVKRTLSIDLNKDYYLSTFYKKQIPLWVDENASFIKKIPEESISRISQTVQEGYMKGRSYQDIAKDLVDYLDGNERRALFIARDQIGTLNGQITKAQQQEAGVSRYIWSTSKDARVRDSHRKLEGKTFSWDDPPVISDDGRRGHPCDDYNCRCVAIPVFDDENLNLVLGGEKKEEPEMWKYKYTPNKRTRLKQMGMSDEDIDNLLAIIEGR